MGKEKGTWELRVKNILYSIENKKEQEQILEILHKYEEKIPDGKLKNLFQKMFLKRKKDYYSKVDYLIDDILEGNIDIATKKILAAMLIEIKKVVESNEKSFWDRLFSIFEGS